MNHEKLIASLKRWPYSAKKCKAAAAALGQQQIELSWSYAVLHAAQDYTDAYKLCCLNGNAERVIETLTTLRQASDTLTASDGPP